jgi:hypothetical protein
MLRNRFKNPDNRSGGTSSGIDSTPHINTSRKCDRGFYARPLADREIRLLRLHSVSRDGPTRRELVYHPLDGGVKFTALSYAWGFLDVDFLLQVDGFVLHISRVVHTALRRLYELSRGCNDLFWVDSICINRDDPHEKNSQVRLMREIYSAANDVLGWLGEPDEHDWDGVDLLLKIFDVWYDPDVWLDKVDPERVVSRIFLGSRSSNSPPENVRKALDLAGRLESLCLPDLNHPAWDALLGFMNKP